MSLGGKALGRLRFLAHWRCAEPVVVLESDDWGWVTHPCADLVARFGKPKPWAEEDTETSEDLEALFEVLGRRTDRAGRRVCLTANFVSGTPDFAEIRRDGAARYADRAIASADLPHAMYAEGRARGLLFPQYHGRSHLRPDLWLRDLRDREPLATALLDRGIAGGLNLVERNGWRYHSEYASWPGGEQDDDATLRDWIQGGLAMFRDTFGFEPATAAAPHYILPPRAAARLRDGGIRAVQAAGYRILLPGSGRKRVVSHVMGEFGKDGLVCLNRNVKLEPCRGHAPWDADAAVERARACFRARIPAVFDTHRMNYTGRNRCDGLLSLGSVLDRLAEDGPLFLTSAEFAEAVGNDGHFRDASTGEKRRLHAFETAHGRLARRILARVNDAILSRSDPAPRGAQPV